MTDWYISATGIEPLPARRLAQGAIGQVLTGPTQQPILLSGTSPLRLAAIAEGLLHIGHRLILVPDPRPTPLPEGTALVVTDGAVSSRTRMAWAVRSGWDLAMFTSGSTRSPRAFGFTRTQLETVTGWYERIYRATGDSVIVTSLPVTYNITFLAGVLLAARLGARLHLASTPERALRDAARLAGTADRVMVLANPLLLDHLADQCRLPDTVLIDSAGALLSVPAIVSYRDTGFDVREGYGLTETASLTHFDTEGTAASLGTAGIPMPGVRAGIDHTHGKPVLEITSPAIGIPIDPRTPLSDQPLRTTDLAQIDMQGRLRLLGRNDDEPINGQWPRDTLDAAGTVLGRRCALIRHPTCDSVLIEPASPLDTSDAAVLRKQASEHLGIPPNHITIDHRGGLPHTCQLQRRT